MIRVGAHPSYSDIATIYTGEGAEPFACVDMQDGSLHSFPDRYATKAERDSANMFAQAIAENNGGTENV